MKYPGLPGSSHFGGSCPYLRAWFAANWLGLFEGSSLTLSAPSIDGSKQGQLLLAHQHVLTEKQPLRTLLVFIKLQKHTCFLQQFTDRIIYEKKFSFECPFHSSTLKFHFPEVKTIVFKFSVFRCLFMSIFFPNEIFRNLSSFVFHLNGLPGLPNYVAVSALTPSGTVATPNDLPLPLLTSKEVSLLRQIAPLLGSLDLPDAELI